MEYAVVMLTRLHATRRSVLGLVAGLGAALVAGLGGGCASAPTPYRAGGDMTELQQRFVDMRMGMFVHYNMATYQDREWGDPDGPESAFAPTALDTDQWARAARSAGMRYGCLTTKHHDGFCLWPTTSGGDSVGDVAGGVDVVRRFVDSFRAQGLRVGLYYSILDLRGDIRPNNVTPDKVARIERELTELLTNYGAIDFLVFDGWDAPWSRITYEEVPFESVYRLVKRLQPDCLVAELNAGVYPSSALYYSDIKSYEQNAGQKLPEDSLLPALSCVTLSDGWFWKSSDGGAELKSARQVVDEWMLPLNRRYCNLIVNAAPNREGRFSPNLVARLEEIGELLRQRGELGPMPRVREAPVITTRNLATGRPIRASGQPDTVGPDLADDGRFSTTWYLPDGATEGWLEVELAPGTSFNRLVFSEPVGRWDDYRDTRVAGYTFEAWTGQGWRELASGTSTNPVRVVEIDRTSARRVRLLLRGVRGWATPHVAEIGVYDEPARE